VIIKLHQLLRTISILLVFVTESVIAHGTHQATFTFDIIDDQLIVDVVFHRHDLHNLVEKDSNCLSEKEFIYCANQYINDHFKCKLNNEFVQLEFEASTTIDDYVKLRYMIDREFRSIYLVHIIITCFESFSEEYSNIIILKFDNDNSYKLDQDRTEFSLIFKSKTD